MSVEPETRAATATDTDTNNHNTIARENNVHDGEGKKQAFGRGVGDGRQWDEFLIGARGGDQIVDYLGAVTNDEELVRAIAEVHQRTGLSEHGISPMSLSDHRSEYDENDQGEASDIESLLKIFDLHKFRRAETYKMVLEVAKQKLVREVVDKGGGLADDISMLVELLNASFRYIGVKELRDIPLCVLARLITLHNRRVRAHRMQLDGARKQKDKEALRAFIDVPVSNVDKTAAGSGVIGRGVIKFTKNAANKQTKESASLARRREVFRSHVEQRDALLRYHRKDIEQTMRVSSMYNSTAITIPTRPQTSSASGIAASGSQSGRAGRGGLSVSGRNDINIDKNFFKQLVEASDEVWDAVPPIVKQQIFFELSPEVLRKKCWGLVKKSIKALDARHGRCAFDLAVINLGDGADVMQGDGIDHGRDVIDGDLDPMFTITRDFSMHWFRNGGCASFSSLISMLVGGETQRDGAEAAELSSRQLNNALTDRSDLQVVPMYRLIIRLLNQAWYDHRNIDKAKKPLFKSAKECRSRASVCTFRAMVCMKMYDESIGAILAADLMNNVISSTEAAVSRAAAQVASVSLAHRREADKIGAADRTRGIALPSNAAITKAAAGSGVSGAAKVLVSESGSMAVHAAASAAQSVQLGKDPYDCNVIGAGGFTLQDDVIDNLHKVCAVAQSSFRRVNNKIQSNQKRKRVGGGGTKGKPPSKKQATKDGGGGDLLDESTESDTDDGGDEEDSAIKADDIDEEGAREMLMRDLAVVLSDPSIFTAICCTLVNRIETVCARGADDLKAICSSTVEESSKVLPRHSQDIKFLTQLLMVSLGMDHFNPNSGMPAPCDKLLEKLYPAIAAVLVESKLRRVRRHIACEKERQQSSGGQKIRIKKIGDDVDAVEPATDRETVDAQAFSVMRTTTKDFVSSRVARCIWCCALLRRVALNDEEASMAMLSTLKRVIADNFKANNSDDEVVVHTAFEMFGTTFAKLLYQKIWSSFSNLKPTADDRAAGGLSGGSVRDKKPLTGFRSFESLRRLFTASFDTFLVRLAETSKQSHVMCLKILTLVAKCSFPCEKGMARNLCDVRSFLSRVRSMMSRTKRHRREYCKALPTEKGPQEQGASPTGTGGTVERFSDDYDFGALYRELVTAVNENASFRSQYAEVHGEIMRTQKRQDGADAVGSDPPDVFNSFSCPEIIKFLEECSVTTNNANV